MTRTRIGVVAALALILPLAACSSDDESVQAFCDQGKAAFDQSNEAAPQDPAEFLNAAADMSSQFHAVQPPEAIADDWAVLTSMISNMHAALSGVDPTDTEAFSQAFSEYSSSVDTERTTEASENVSAYIEDTCS